jgi:hypothetical protein
MLLVVALVTLVACASRAADGSSGQVWDGEGVRFTAPPDWNLRAGGELPSGLPSDIRESVTDYVVFVTNQRFVTNCGPGVAGLAARWRPSSSVWTTFFVVASIQRTALPGGEVDRADGFCAFITQLEPGGVVVAWSAHHCVAHGCDLPAGDQILVGGRVAVRYPGPGLCRDLLATEEEVVIVTVTPQRVDRIVTCSRDVSPATTAALATMFDSIQWRTP